MKLVSENDNPTRTPAFSRGFSEALKRVASITAPSDPPKGLDEYKALLLVFKWVVSDLERKIEGLKNKKLSVVESRDGQC